MEATGKLTNVQVELLKLFKYELSQSQLVEIKEMLAKYFSTAATKEMDRLWDENNWDETTVQKWSDEHLRKK